MPPVRLHWLSELVQPAESRDDGGIDTMIIIHPWTSLEKIPGHPDTRYFWWVVVVDHVLLANALCE